MHHALVEGFMSKAQLLGFTSGLHPDCTLFFQEDE